MGPGGSKGHPNGQYHWEINGDLLWSIAYTVYVETHIHHWNYSGSELGLILKLLVVIYIDLQ